jgi:hypothetical protein
MMVRVFHTGTGSAESAISYLMGINDHTGKPRSIAPEWLHGSPSLFQLVSNSTTRKHKYVSGAISFRDHEHPSEQQVLLIIEAFRASFLPGLKECENYADAWIAHRDKSNLELHFVVAGTEIQTGRQLNIHPPGPRNIEHFQAFTQVMNQAMGYDQVVADPLKVALSEFEAKSQAGKKSRRVKTLLAKELHSHIVSGSIINRDELITHLEDNYGDVTRVGKDYISIRLPGSSKAKRLRGPLFHEDADYAQLVAQHHRAQQPQKLTPQEYAQAQATLEKLTLERAAYFAKRYKKKTSFQRSIRRKGVEKLGRTASISTPPQTASMALPAKHAGTPPASPLASAVGRIQGLAQSNEAPPKVIATVTANRRTTDTEEGPAALPEAGVSINAAGVTGMEMQLGSLAQLVSKLTVKARTTSNTAYYEILRAQIVKLQHQMTLLSLNLEAEKARTIKGQDQAEGASKPKA